MEGNVPAGWTISDYVWVRSRRMPLQIAAKSCTSLPEQEIRARITVLTFARDDNLSNVLHWLCSRDLVFSSAGRASRVPCPR
jgi:hypothetical protein